MNDRRFRMALILLLSLGVSLAGSLAYGQGAVTSSLSGTVTDSSGAIVPGADVTIKNNATGMVLSAVTGSGGTYTITAVQPGTYTVTITLSGFRTWTSPDVIVNAATPATVNARLEVGKLEETVVVEGAVQLVQTQTSAITNTISSKQITNLPGSRAAFDVIMLLPGVASATSGRYGQVNGLPQSLVNITLDGMNIQDNYLKTTDGMFTRVSPRIDAVEEVTVSTAGMGADTSGQGGVQVRFVTRSGTNRYQGSAYYYFQREWMNTNTWFNTHRSVDATTGAVTPKPTLALYQPGFRLGGPIVIPNLFDGHDKAFFFINYEIARSPGTYSLNRTIISPEAQQGLFRYGSATPVDLYALATRYGQTNTPDPRVGVVLDAIRAATGQTGTVNANPGDPLTQNYNWQFPTKGTTKYPTLRFDYNITSKHRLSASGTQNHLISDPDTLNGYYRNFPGFSTNGMQDSYRWTFQFSLRSALGADMVNELRLGGTGGATYFNPELNAGMFTGGTPDMTGYGIYLQNFRSLSNPYSAYTNSSREASTRVLEDNLNWIKGKHSMTFGASFTQPKVWLANQQYVPRVQFGLVSGDPAEAMFTTANFPGATSTDLTNARNLYSLLTGRVSSLDVTARIASDGSQFVNLGSSYQVGRLRQLGFYFQDSWKMKPSLTVNVGLRYDIQYPFYSMNNSYSTATVNDIFGITGPGSNFVPGSTVTGIGNLYSPGTLQGQLPAYQNLAANNYGYSVDYNNVAPSIGVAWKLPEPKNFLRHITGQDAVIRGGYNIAYQRGGMSDFTGVFGSNQGITWDDSRNANLGNLGPLPLLFRSGDLSVPAGPVRNYPLATSVSSSINTFDPNIKVPYSTSFTVGMQRALTKTMVAEARFIHTGSHGVWASYNYNETNIVENGFLNEFRLAQANLAANGGTSFAYTGAPGTSPLPLLLAYLNGQPASQASNSALYTTPAGASSNPWRSSTYIGYLAALNPNVFSFASNLRGNATYRANAIGAGLPANFFLVNPNVSSANITTNGPDTRYNGVQFTLTRRFSGGLQLQTNYSYGKGYQNDFYSFRRPFVETEQNYNNSTTNATGNIRHVFQANWVYELPFGQGKPFGGGVGRNLNRLIGNWAYMGTARVQSGRIIDLGNVRLVNMTPDDVRDMLQMRFTTDTNNRFRTVVYNWPQDVIDNTIRAFSVTYNGYGSGGAPTGRYFAPANGPSCIEVAQGYGDCGVRSLLVTGPRIIRFDMSVGKDIMITSRVGFQFQVQVFNVFNHVNFSPVNGIGSSTTSGFEVTSAVDQARTMQLVGRINW